MKLTDAEWTVMHALWGAPSPASARDVLEAIHERTGWSYSTVKTMLARLVEKQAVSARRRGNVVLYEPLVQRDTAQTEAVRSLLDRAFDGVFGSLVHRLVDVGSLSKKDRQKLETLLAELDSPNKK
jgi:predicted transcriptional regulator